MFPCLSLKPVLPACAARPSPWPGGGDRVSSPRCCSGTRWPRGCGRGAVVPGPPLASGPARTWSLPCSEPSHPMCVTSTRLRGSCGRTSGSVSLGCGRAREHIRAPWYRSPVCCWCGSIRIAVFSLNKSICVSLECAEGSQLLILLFNLMKEPSSGEDQSPWEHLR